MTQHLTLAGRGSRSALEGGGFDRGGVPGGRGTFGDMRYVRTAKNAGVWKGYNTPKDWVNAIVTAGAT